MKLKKSAYLPLFLLFCFLASFSTNIYKNVYFSPIKSNLKNQDSLVFSSKEQGLANINDFQFEKNENENKTTFQAQAYVLPFFISDFPYQIVKIILISAKPLAEKLSNPIYISYCNIRI